MRLCRQVRRRSQSGRPKSVASALVDGKRGLALLRIDRVAEAQRDGMPVTVAGLPSPSQRRPSQHSPSRLRMKSPKASAVQRCPWAGIDDPIYATYHDEEWGVPHADDRRLFEKLVLEGFGGPFRGSRS